jgi:murein DD-endopeptidase MepM/ murein hydrolase activator NlpD
VVSVVKDLGARSYGRYIVISHAGGIQTLYAHLSGFRTSVGSKVSTGQLIGISGNTGGSRGPHLHFELKPSGDTIRAMAARGVRLASGGVVRSTPGGVLATLAEAGKNERVEPLDSQGLSARDRALIREMARQFGVTQGGGGNAYVLNVQTRNTEQTIVEQFKRLEMVARYTR